jgi:hypothetical protein
VYPNGTMTLSVKELANAKATKAYFNGLARTLGRDRKLTVGKGAEGFSTRSGDAVIRKDYKVLRVDVSKLPPQFGSPPDTRATAAESVASVVMGCWTGA